jgi:hypothetical protein
VSVVTAVSPRAAVDMFFVLVTALGLMRRLALLYGGRPGTLTLLKLMRQAVSHLALTGGMAASDSLIQQVIGHGLAAKLSARLGEGVLNGLLTARLGLAAIAATRPLPFKALRQPALNDLAGALLRGAETGTERACRRTTVMNAGRRSGCGMRQGGQALAPCPRGSDSTVRARREERSHPTSGADVGLKSNLTQQKPTDGRMSGRLQGDRVDTAEADAGLSHIIRRVGRLRPAWWSASWCRSVISQPSSRWTVPASPSAPMGSAPRPSSRPCWENTTRLESTALR